MLLFYSMIVTSPGDRVRFRALLKMGYYGALRCHRFIFCVFLCPNVVKLNGVTGEIIIASSTSDERYAKTTGNDIW